jgi:hypothetical protein
MKQFMAVFLGSPDAIVESRKNMTPETESKMQEGMREWGKWIEKYKGSIVFDGAPLGKTKKVNKEGVSDTRNDMGAYVVVQAESHEEAAKMFENHPHFMIFPGDRVEVMEHLPLPGQR